MSIFLSIIKTIFKRTYHYRMGQMLSIIIYPVYLTTFILVFVGLYSYKHTDTLAGFDLAQIIWYQMGAMLIGTITYNETAWYIAHKILTGDLVQDLLRPVSVFKFQLAEAIGMRLMAMCVEFLPGIIILPFLFFPSFLTGLSVLRFIPVALGAFILNYHISFLIGLLAFAMKSTTSILPIRDIIIWTLGGGRLPLDFFPPVIKTINTVIPFQYIFYQPLRVFLNMPDTRTPAGYLTIVGIQAAWIVGLHLLTRILWRGAFRRFCAVGS